MSPRVIVGVDPGGQDTGVVLDIDGHLVRAAVVERRRAEGQGAYLHAVLRCIEEYAAVRPEAVVAVEDLVHPHSHVNGKPRVINVDGLTSTAIVLGAILGRWPDALLVPPGDNGSAPLQTYPSELVGKRERSGAGVLRHCRSAWDVARTARQILRRGPLDQRSDVTTMEVRRRARLTREAGVSGLIEVVIALMVIGILMSFTIPIYLSSRKSADNNASQQVLKAALVSIGNVYNETQTYGLFSTTRPTTEVATGGCSLTASATQNLAAYDHTAVFTCSPLSTYRPHTVTLKAGSLTGGRAGGWVGLASRAQSTNVCWQIYIPATSPAVYGSSTSASCSAPSSPPGGKSWS